MRQKSVVYIISIFMLFSASMIDHLIETETATGEIIIKNTHVVCMTQLGSSYVTSHKL